MQVNNRQIKNLIKYKIDIVAHDLRQASYKDPSSYEEEAKRKFHLKRCR